MKNSTTIATKSIFTHGFLLCVILLPIVSLFWQETIPLIGFKINWLVYPLVIVLLACTLTLRKQAPLPFLILCAMITFYLIISILRGGDSETLIRFFTSVLPFTFIDYFYEHKSSYKWFWPAYFVALLIPLYLAYLQYTNRYPYFEYDTVDGENVGRISAGYNKPMNFITFLFPVFLFGFYLIMVQKKKFPGYILVILLCLLLWVIGHRTSLLAFLVIVATSFIPSKTSRLIYNYYKKFLHFYAGVLAFFAMYLVERYVGLFEGLRGRIPMWEAHAESFFNSSFLNILIGKQTILLDPDKYSHHVTTRLIGSLDEAHNNTFRTIIFFGIAGYFAYCIFVRWLVVKTYQSTENPMVRFIRLSCFTFLILFSNTNEPFYYTGLLWPLLLPLLPVIQDKQQLQQV